MHYKGKYRWWELVVMARKLVVIFFSLFFTRFTIYQTVGALFTFVTFAVLQMVFKPVIHLS